MLSARGPRFADATSRARDVPTRDVVGFDDVAGFDGFAALLDGFAVPDGFAAVLDGFAVPDGFAAVLDGFAVPDVLVAVLDGFAALLDGFASWLDDRDFGGSLTSAGFDGWAAGLVAAGSATCRGDTIGWAPAALGTASTATSAIARPRSAMQWILAAMPIG